MTDDKTKPSAERDLSEFEDEADLPAGISPIEIVKHLGRSPNLLAAIEMSLQSTTGSYPPPAMMAEYNKIDPAINQQILSEAKLQADHRRSLEKLATARSEDRQDKAQKNQQIVALFSLVAAVIIIALPLYLTGSIGWPIAIAAALIGAVGVGGRPAATILTAYIAKQFPRE